MVDDAVSYFRRSLELLIPRMPLFGVDYDRAHITRDMIAGATVASILIPQSMAYALLAGLPPAHGLYAALIGGIAGALWSHSRYLATGPIAITSLLTLTAVAPLAAVGSTGYIALVAALAALVGLIQIGAGLMRLGFLMRLVPQSVLTGFSSAAALLIILTQIPHILGFSATSSGVALAYLSTIISNLTTTHFMTLVLGAASLALLLGFKRFFPHFPATLAVLVLGIGATYLFNLGELGVKLAGAIPTRLPITDIPTLSFGLVASLGGQALIIAFVGFMSSYAVVKDIGAKTKEKTFADQELIGQGFANLFAGFFRGYPVGGSLSRTAVNYSAGAVTAWSGVFASLFVVVAILFLSPILAKLPNAVLAAIVVTAVLPLVDITSLRRMYAITKTDGIIAIATFAAVFLARPDEAVLFGVILALVLYMQKIMWVQVIEVGIHPRWNTMHIREQYPEVQSFAGTLMLRIDAPLFYANIERLHSDIVSHVHAREAARDVLERIVLDFSGVNHVDVTGVDGFKELVRELKEKKIDVYVITVKQESYVILEKGGALEGVTQLHNVRELQALLEARKGARMLIV